MVKRLDEGMLRVMIYLRLATRPSSRRRLASGHAAAPPRSVICW